MKATKWLLLLLACLLFHSSLSKIIHIDPGFIDGIEYENDKVFAWLGVPYAAPPIGDNRFRRPQPLVPWDNTVLSTKNFGAGCLQYCPGSEVLCPRVVDESCLFINVWAPASAFLVPPPPPSTSIASNSTYDDSPSAAAQGAAAANSTNPAKIAALRRRTKLMGAKHSSLHPQRAVQAKKYLMSLIAHKNDSFLSSDDNHTYSSNNTNIVVDDDTDPDTNTTTNTNTDPNLTPVTNPALTALRATRSLPVLVFIHGGAFLLGHAGSYPYHGQKFAKQDMVVVTFNYRLGALGFAAFDEENNNFGLYDQYVALKWIKQNIRWFGGNPDMVTLAGQSAGAMSTQIHMCSEHAQGLFHRVIILSPFAAVQYPTQAMVQKTTAEALGARVGCEGSSNLLECFRRNVTSEALLNAQSKLMDGSLFDSSTLYSLLAGKILAEIFDPFVPTLGDYFPEQPLQTFLANKHVTKVPAIFGSTEHEMKSFLPLAFTKSEAVGFLTVLFGVQNIPTIESVYKFVDDKNNADTVQDVMSDSVISCPLIGIAKNSITPVYMYRYDHTAYDPRVWMERESYCGNRVCHGSDLPGLFWGKDSREMSKEIGDYVGTHELQLSEIMHQHFTNFVKTGNPNAGSTAIPGVAYWSPMKRGTVGPAIVFDMPVTWREYATPPNRCQVWEKVGFGV